MVLFVMHLKVFFALFFRMCFAHTSDKGVTWSRDRKLDDIIKVNGFPHREVRAANVRRCAAQCTSNTLCSSFFFLPNTGICHLNEFIFAKPNGGQPSPGARYFKAVSADCPVSNGYVWLRGPGMCIKISINSTSFKSAYSKCTSQASRLAVLDTAAKHTSVTAYLADQDSSSTEAYIGGTREGVINSSRTSWNITLHPMYWLTGAKVATKGSEAFWSRGQPDNYRGTEGCMQVTLGQWNDLECTKVKPFICEKILM